MSATNFVTNIPVFEGAQGKYYIVNGKKYSVYFPIAWAHEHITFQIGDDEAKSGPEECGNCDTYGSIRGVFVGYCSNCLWQYHDSQYWRGCLVAPGLPVDMLRDSDIWAQYPYMSGIPKSAIGDEEGADLTDQGVNLEELNAAISAADGNEDEQADEEAIVILGDEQERSITPDPVFFHNPHDDTDDEDEARFDKNGRWIYPEHVLRELDRLDRKGLLYSDKADDDSVNSDGYCEECLFRHPGYNCQD